MHRARDLRLQALQPRTRIERIRLRVDAPQLRFERQLEIARELSPSHALRRAEQ